MCSRGQFHRFPAHPNAGFRPVPEPGGHAGDTERLAGVPVRPVGWCLKIREEYVLRDIDLSTEQLARGEAREAKAVVSDLRAKYGL